MSYACVQDVPASWATYLEILEDLGEETPMGFLSTPPGRPTRASA